MQDFVGHRAHAGEREKRVGHYLMAYIEANVDGTAVLSDRSLDKRYVGLRPASSRAASGTKPSRSGGGEDEEEDEKEEEKAVSSEPSNDPQSEHLVYSFLLPAAREAFTELLSVFSDSFRKDESFFVRIFQDRRLSNSAKGNAVEVYILYRLWIRETVEVVTISPPDGRESVISFHRSIWSTRGIQDLGGTGLLPWGAQQFVAIPKSPNFRSIDFVLWDRGDADRRRTLFAFQVTISRSLSEHLRKFDMDSFSAALRQQGWTSQGSICVVWMIPRRSTAPSVDQCSLLPCETTVCRHVAAFFESQRKESFPSLDSIVYAQRKG